MLSTVKLHSDTGIVYFTSDGVQSWDDPLKTSVFDLQPIFSKGTDPEKAEIEELAGMDLAPDGSVFQSSEVTSALASLGQWVEDNQLEVGDVVRC